MSRLPFALQHLAHGVDWASRGNGELGAFRSGVPVVGIFLVCPAAGHLEMPSGETGRAFLVRGTQARFSDLLGPMARSCLEQ